MSMDVQAIKLQLPTITEAKLARKLLRRAVPIERIIAYLGGCYSEANITAGIERMRVHCRQRNARDTDKGWRGVVAFEPVRNIPREVKADRDRRAALSHPPERFPFGDPLPGCGAVAHSPSIVAAQIDPLADLIFKPRAKRQHEQHADTRPHPRSVSPVAGQQTSAELSGARDPEQVRCGLER